jgi:hypothetical protein
MSPQKHLKQRAIFVSVIVVVLVAAVGAASRSRAKERVKSGSVASAITDKATTVRATAGLPLAPVERNPDRNAYFGETHVHTSWSLDAWLGGDRITDPGDAYKYFKGEPIKHPLGYDVKIGTPLDWAGVTDHSEYVGVTKLANDANSPISKLPAAQPLILKNDSIAEAQRVFEYVVNNLLSGHVAKALDSPEVAGTIWRNNIELANQANVPGKLTG